MPEFLQDDCRPDALAEAVATLLEDPLARQTQISASAEALVRLGRFGPSPSLRAADAILDTIRERPS